MNTRRDFMKFTALAGGLVAGQSVTTTALAGLPELVSQNSADTQDPLRPEGNALYNPVVTLNGWTLPWRMKDGVKEFHLDTTQL